LRSAIRFNPDDAKAHAALSLALEAKGNLPAAMAEAREAYLLDPNNTRIKEWYEGLLRKVNQK
jgi:Flp pilus assembly protein TadD